MYEFSAYFTYKIFPEFILFEKTSADKYKKIDS